MRAIGGDVTRILRELAETYDSDQERLVGLKVFLRQLRGDLEEGRVVSSPDDESQGKLRA